MHDWKKIIRERIAPLRLQGIADAELIDEFAQHLEDRYRELCSGGATDEEAFRVATSELDDMYPVEAELGRNHLMTSYDLRRGNYMDDLWRDLRFTARSMKKNPIFVLFVVLTLGLGIGANTTVFTLINTFILNPLPVPNSSELAAIALTELKSTSKSKAALPVSYPDLKDYRSQNGVFSSLAGYSSLRIMTLQSGPTSERVFGELVTADYFSTLGLKPAKGRFFLPEEDSTPGAHSVAVMNYGTWQARLGAADDIIGRTLRLNNVAVTVIGIAPPRFIGMNAMFGPDLWIPAAMAELLLPNELRGAMSDRSKGVFQGVGRLKPGVSRAQAQANIAAIAASLAREYPAADEGRSATVLPISAVLFGSASSGSSPVLFGSMVLLAVVGIVLLIACSNVANLLLARSAARQQEVAVRLAIGASRGRLTRQFLTESVFLGFLSGVAGLVVGYAGLRTLWSALPSSANFVAPKLDATVFVFALLVSLLTGFVFGTIPAVRTSRVSVAGALKEESHSVGKSRSRITFANALLVGQVAFSFVLLVTAALFLRSIERAYGIDPGFQTRNLAIFMTNPGQAGYEKPQTQAFYKEVRERVARIPGVASASWASNLPLWGRLVSGLQIENREQRSKSDSVTTLVNTVDINYFGTAGVPIEAGREFSELDRENSMAVAIVNEKLAHDYWPNQTAIGKRIRLPNEKIMRQVIGVAKTANYSTLGEQPQLCVYVPLEQNFSDAMILYVRSKSDPEQILMPVQREVRNAGPQILVSDIRTGRKIVEGGLFQAKIGVTLLSVFGLLALGLASIGLYGIMAYSVNLRKREIGLRMALGAARENVLRLILKQGMSLVLAGVAIGLVAAWGVGHVLAGMLYGVSASDPISVTAAAIVLLTVALVACYLPARRASRVDPLVALREG